MLTAEGRKRAALPVVVGVAAVLFSLLFTGIRFHFWYQMALTAGGLCVLAFLLEPKVVNGAFRTDSLSWGAAVGGGLLSAACLYVIFYAGNYISRVLFAFSGPDIESVYGLKGLADVRIIVFLLLFVIGPGEEIFWRGYVQRKLSRRHGIWGVGLAVLVYGLVHLAAGNPMLILAALVCGAFWGLLYWRFESLWLNIVSHAAWDVAVFVLLPFTGGG